MANRRREVAATSSVSHDGDTHVTLFDGGWRLTVTLHKGVVSGATAELRNDDIREHYAVTQQSNALFDLAPNGYEADMSVDNNGRPTVIWRKDDGSSPFVWFCALEIADWSHPLS